MGVRLQSVEVRTEESYLHGPRRAREIVDDVRENLHELDVQTWHGGADLVAHVGDDLEDRAAALARWLETGHDVAGILLRSKQTKLRTRATGRSRNLRRARQNVLGDVQLAIRLGERRSTGREVVEHERPLVHLRQKARSDESMCEIASNDQHDCDDDHPTRVM